MEGEIYIEVDASVLNPGISPMAIVSGDPEPPEGATPMLFWIRWYYDDTDGSGGFSGSGWYVGDPNNILTEYYDSNDEFIKDLLADGHGKPWLDNILQQWDGDKKFDFFVSHQDSLGAGFCFTGFSTGS